MENLESRQLMAADLSGVRLILDATAGSAQVAYWTGEHEVIPPDSSSAPTRFLLTADDERLGGELDFSNIQEIGWNQFSLFADGRLGASYKGSVDYPLQVGTSMYAADGYGLGWLSETGTSGSGAISFLQEQPSSVTIEDLIGHWSFVTIALTTSGSASSGDVLGAYGSFDVLDKDGAISYQYDTIGDTGDGTDSIQELAATGFGLLKKSEYFTVGSDKNSIVAADMSYGDGRTYITVALRRGEVMTEAEIAGEYRFGSVIAGEAATRRGADVLAFENAYLKLNLDGTLTSYDLADHDAGTDTVLHTGRWTLLPEGRTLSVQYDDSGESHFFAFGADKKTLIDLRIGHENGNSYTIGEGVRVNEDDGSGDGSGGGGGGGGGGNQDDYGQGDDGSGDTLIDNVPLPRYLFAGRAPTGRQAVWEFGRDVNWYYSKVGVRNDALDLVGELVTWQSKKEYYAAAASESGMLLFKRGETGPYAMRNLTDEIGDTAELPAAAATLLTLSDGRAVLISLNADGDVIAYVQSGTGSSFSFLNISQNEIRDKEGEVPALTGKLAAGVTKWESAIIAGLDAEGQVWTVWFSTQSAQDGWQASPLGKIAGAPTLAGNLSMYFTDWKGINIAGLTSAGASVVLWWVPSFKGNWQTTNLTDKFDGPAFNADSMTTYTTPWNSLTVVGITAENHLVAYWWVPGFQSWRVSDFDEFLPSKLPRITNGPLQATVRDNKDIWIFGRGTTGDMIRVLWSHDRDKWSSKSLLDGAQQF
ncbi:MAG: hypothetical protein IPJ41_03550 [Phycisphaerales bacterium]|nr:hypothetical protein [Phycisphaerales bacterium]